VNFEIALILSGKAFFSNHNCRVKPNSPLTGIYVDISETGFDVALIREYKLLIFISLNFQLPSVPVLKQIQSKASRQTEHVFFWNR